MSDKTYAQFNSMTITGRLSFAEMVEHDGRSWLSVTLLSELVDDSRAVAITFNTTNGLMSLYNSGWLNAGRLVTVTGHVASFSEVYFNKKTGKREMLKRPRLHLTKAQVFDGGLGPAKKQTESVSEAGAPVDDIDEVAASAGVSA